MKTTNREAYTVEYLHSAIDSLIYLLRTKGTTVQEIADTIGVSKQAISLRLKKLAKK